MNTTSGQSTPSAKEAPIAKLYAGALFEYAAEKNDVAAVHDELTQLVQLVRENAELRRALTAFMFAPEDKDKLAADLAEKAKMHPVLARFLRLLIMKSRVSLLEGILEAFQGRVDEGSNTVRGTVTTVEPLTDAQKADLCKAFAKKFNKQVVLESRIDKDLLGGLVVRVHGLTFDGSLATMIRRLKESLERQSI